MSQPANNQTALDETDPDAKIAKAYEQENIRLLAENKKLAAQIAAGDSDVKIENQDLRRKVIELENKLKAAGDNSQLREEYDAYIKQATQQILTLKERNQELLLENQQLAAKLNESQTPNISNQWDADQEQNNAIEKLIQNLKTAYKRQNGTEEALSQLAAIIDPECIVSRDKPQPTPGPFRKQAQQQQQTPQGPRQTYKEARKQSPPKSRPKASRPVPSYQVGAQQSMKVKELERQIEELNKKIEDQTKEMNQLRNRNKERLNKNKELQQLVDESNQKMLDANRDHQVQISEYQIKQQSMEAELKVLQTNANYRTECEELKVKIAALEAQNAELMKPKTTGDPKSDRVLDAITRMENDIRQRQLSLDRVIGDLQEQWETEKRTMQKKFQNQIDEKNEQLLKAKEDIEEIYAQLDFGSKSKRKRN